MNLGLRIEASMAMLAFVVSGGRGELADYLPQREVDEAAALARAMREWR